MITLASYIGIMFALVFVIRRHSQDIYTIPRQTFFILISLFCGWSWLIYDASLQLNLLTVKSIGFMLIWWFLCSVLSKHKNNSLRLFTFFSSVVILMSILKSEYLLIGTKLLMFGVLLNCLYAISQNIFWKDFLHINTIVGDIRPTGFIGNINMLGHFLGPCVFISIWLGLSDSWFWFILTGIILFTLFLTHCRGAMFGLMSGVLFLGFYFELWPLFFIVLVFIPTLVLSFKNGSSLTKEKIYSLLSFKERLCYLKLAFSELPRVWLFGLGFDGFKSRVPFIQRDLNEKSKGEFLKRENYLSPFPQKCHNDYLQHILDGGVVNLGFILWFIYLAFSCVDLTNSMNLWFSVGLISYLASSLVLHNFHIPTTNILFWFLVFTLIRSEEVVQVPVNSLSYFIVFIFVTLICKYIMREFLYDMYLIKSLRGKQLPLKALRLKPRGSMVNSFAAAFYHSKNNFSGSFIHSIYGLVNFDGQQKYWEIWTNLGIALFITRSFILAKFCFETALKFNPNHFMAQQGLKQVNNFIKTPPTGGILDGRT